MKAEGIDIIDLSVGEPDFPTPDYVKQAGVKAIEDNFTKYTQNEGIPELKDAMIKRFNRYELKYLVDARRYQSMASDLAHFMTPDPHGDIDGFYRVTSLYYDSPGLSAYWSKLDGLKFRTRAGMGRCQGGFCTWRLMQVLARESGIPMSSVTKRGAGSWIVLDRAEVQGGPT